MVGSALASLPQRLADCLHARLPADKVACVHVLQTDWVGSRIDVSADTARIPIDQPEATFRQLLVDYDAPPLKPPFNLAARRAAGFSEPELDWLKTL